MSDNSHSDIKAVFEDIKSTSNELFRCIKCNGEEEYHYHDYIEYIHALTKNLIVSINGIDYSLDVDDFIIVIPGDKHSITNPNGGLYLSLAFDKSFVFSSALTSSDLHHILPNENCRLFKASNNYSLEGIDSHGTGVDAKSLLGLAGKTVEECEVKRNFYRLAVRSNLSQISLFVFREWQKVNQFHNTTTHSDKGISRIESILHEIDVHYSEQISAEKMAELAGMSYSYFSRYFKAVMKMTFSEYLNQKRIEEAEKLLIETDIPIFDVSTMVGFTNTSYFIAQFKKRRMMTPKKFKSRYAKRD